MSRYIDKDAFVKSIKPIASKMPFGMQSDIANAIVSAPSIEIVRCKECIFADCDDKAEMYRCRSVSFPHWNKGEHFCSYGERREP